MKVFKIFLDILAVLWVVLVVVMLAGFSPFLSDSPNATLRSALVTWVEGFVLLAGVPTGWLLLRFANRRLGQMQTKDK